MQTQLGEAEQIGKCALHFVSWKRVLSRGHGGGTKSLIKTADKLCNLSWGLQQPAG